MSFSEDPRIVEILVQSGADITLKDSKGKTPLQLAAKFFPHNKEIVDLLIKGTNVNAKDKDGVTILHEAASEGNY